MTDTFNMLANGIMQKLPQEKDREAVKKILSGAVTLLFQGEKANEQTDEFIKNAESPEKLVDAIIAVLVLLQKKSKGTMPWGPALAAGEILLLEALARASKAGTVQLTEQMVGDLTKRFIEKLLSVLGISTEHIIDVVRKASLLKTSGMMQGV